MNRKLDIVIPHYKEPWFLCRYLLDTIATQRGILFKDIRVIIVNDGEEGILDTKNLEDYPFGIVYQVIEHGGVSHTRNYGLDFGESDYVMFCDADDGFLNNYALHTIFAAIQENADMIVSNFIEETFDKDGNQTIIRHDKDMTFMHGKVYKREFLKQHNIRFDDAMTIHEDGYFNALAYATVAREGKIRYIDTPLYLWRWNDNSTVRRDRKDFVLKTYDHVIQTRIGVSEELKKRGYDDEYRTSVIMTVLNSYYDFQKTSYHTAENRRYLKAAEKAFRGYWMKYQKVFYDATNLKIAEIARAARENAVNNGMLMEQQDLRTFLKHIEHEVKP